MATSQPTHPMPLDPVEICLRFYAADSLAWSVLHDHCQRVRDKALAAAAQAGPGVDRVFVAEAALLHDIGIIRTHAPVIGCHGSLPYICHGYLGREMLEACDLPRHALVCERHTGTGLSVADIRKQALPLPLRDMRPQSLEEILVCYADNFFSKDPEAAGVERSVDEVLRKLRRHGEDKVRTFLGWHTRFGG